MILPDVEAILGLHAFAGDAGADHFGQAIAVERVHVEGVFEFAAHRVGPWLGAETAELQRGAARVEPLRAEFVDKALARRRALRKECLARNR